MPPWFADDNFWREFEDALFPPERWEAAKQETQYLISLLNLPEDATVLDLCCGPGRHTLQLARYGFRVTGVDGTFYYLQKLNRQARKENLTVETVCDDMKNFSRENYYQAAISMFTSFGYFEEEDDNRRVLSNIYRSLQPGGWLLMEMAGKDILMRNFQPRDWHESEDVFLLEEREVDSEWQYISNRWILFKKGKKYEFSFKLHLYSARELSDLLHSCGFIDVAVFGGLDQSPYDADAKRLVVTAMKQL